MSAQRAFVVRNAWSSARYGTARLGLNPYENVLSTANLSSLSSLWTVAAGGAIVDSPTVSNGVVYFGAMSGSVYAANATTGHVDWSTKLGGAVQSSPTHSGQTVFVGADNGLVYALSATTGDILWSFTTGGPVDSSPLVSGLRGVQ